MSNSILKLKIYSCAAVFSFVILSFCGWVQAATYNLAPPQTPALCNGNAGTWSGSVYVCAWHQPFSLEPGDKLLSGGNIRILSYSGFNLSKVVIGGAGYTIDLEAQGSNTTRLVGVELNGSIYGQSNNVRLEGGAIVRGSVSVTGSFSSASASVYGNVSANNGVSAEDTVFYANINSSSGGVSLVGGAVENDVVVTATKISAQGTVFRGALTSTSGSIELIGGSVAKLVKTNCCSISTNGTNLYGGATAQSGMTIKGDGNTEIRGDYTFTDLNPGYFEGVKMTSGNSIGVAGSATFVNSTIGSDSNPVNIRVNGSANVKLNGSTIYGTVYVPDYGQWSPLITGDSSSRIVGECQRFSGGTRPLSTPASLCDGSGSIKINHLRLYHTGSAISCMATEVSVQACADSSCTKVFPGPASFSLAVGNGSFVNSVVAIDASGQGKTFLRNPNGGLSKITSDTPLVCDFSNCSINFKDSVLFISGDKSALTKIPAQIAGKPFDAYLHSITTNPDTKACEARVEGQKSVSFDFSCVDPNKCVAGQTFKVGENAIPGSRSLTFKNGVSEKLEMAYSDAGKVKVTAELSLPAEGNHPAVVLAGETSFVSRPWGLCLETDTDKSVTNKATDKILTKAGDGFEQRMKAVIWTSSTDGKETDRRSVSLCSNAVTPNYQQASIALESEVIAPSNGKSGALGATEYAQGKGVTTLTQTLSEVGIFRVIASPPNYLGESMGHAVSASGAVGRIIPAWLEVGATLSQAVGCQNPSGFTYQGQTTSLSGALKVIGKNRVGDETKNYIGDFWRFSGNLSYELYQESASPKSGQASAIAGRVIPLPAFAATSASASFLPSGSYSYTRPLSPSALDTPFSLKLAVWDWHDLDNVYFKRTDITQSVAARGLATTGVPVVAAISTSAFRLGRVRSENINVPTGSTGTVPLLLEHWGTAGWAAAVDSCTSLAAPNDLKERLVYENPPITSVTADAVGTWNQQSLGISVQPSTPRGQVLLKHLLTGPNNGATAQPAIWLCQQRTAGDAPLGGVCSYSGTSPAEVRSSVTFGIYEGRKPLIFRREVYR
ncbi:hypothetical protein HW090_04225 [Pseudomonas sp. ABC1]|uniref:DUF6701 domain-containing protein n=1 Tax=Pseudomonas sp. ABC1 TaxID=2748080 RepID=UPI0015C311D2|nr:DUF6701 domain-containing protein [Pseudomonas sp. ABC1]QLF92445.1 hypothetical protein HW090_04225 [Pseudomonas sp. ABC1]